jgi:hypothetical protein
MSGRRGNHEAPHAGAPSASPAYVQVDDIKAVAATAKSLEAAIVTDVTEVMGMGWLSIFIDPTGAALGLWQQRCRPAGASAPQPGPENPSGKH